MAMRWLVSRPSASRTPGKGCEVSVVALAQEAEAEPEARHFGLAGPRKGHPAVGRMGGVVEIERLAGAVARRHPFDRERGHARNLGRTAQSVHGEIDAPELDAAEVAHEIVADH